MSDAIERVMEVMTSMLGEAQRREVELRAEILDLREDIADMVAAQKEAADQERAREQARVQAVIEAHKQDVAREQACKESSLLQQIHTEQQTSYYMPDLSALLTK